MHFSMKLARKGRPHWQLYPDVATFTYRQLLKPSSNMVGTCGSSCKVSSVHAVLFSSGSFAAFAASAVTKREEKCSKSSFTTLPSAHMHRSHIKWHVEAVSFNTKRAKQACQSRFSLPLHGMVHCRGGSLHALLVFWQYMSSKCGALQAARPGTSHLPTAKRPASSGARFAAKRSKLAAPVAAFLPDDDD